MSGKPTPGSGIAVTSDGGRSLELIYQVLDGTVQVFEQKNGKWDHMGLVNTKPVDGSLLAAIRWGKELRLYYLDDNYIVQELCYTEGRGFFPGGTSIMNAKAVPGSGLGAVVWSPYTTMSVRVRVYYQGETFCHWDAVLLLNNPESGSNHVAELAYDHHWYKGELLIKDALGGTSHAAVAFYFENQTQIRVYFQAIDLSLKEHGHNGSVWFTGEFNPGKATIQTPLAALAFGHINLQVYWRDLSGHIVFKRYTKAWGRTEIIPPIAPGYKFAVHQWENGKHLMICYQVFDGSVDEYASVDSGETWHRLN